MCISEGSFAIWECRRPFEVSLAPPASMTVPVSVSMLARACVRNTLHAYELTTSSPFTHRCYDQHTSRRNPAQASVSRRCVTLPTARASWPGASPSTSVCTTRASA